MLKTRVVTALILLPLMLLAIGYLPPSVFALLIGLIVLAASWEWSAMVGFSHFISRIFYMIVILLGLLFVAHLSLFYVMAGAVLMWLWIAAGILSYQKGGKGAFFQLPFVRAFTGFVILVSCYRAITVLQNKLFFGPAWLIFVLFAIMAMDVGAYFSGRLWGKSPLASRVSPKKTWAGFIGGMIFSAIVIAIGALFFNFSWRAYALVFCVTILSALFSVIGDLGVSLVKRISGVKDSGNIVPGHGGVFDRLDSVAAATVVFALAAIWLGL